MHAQVELPDSPPPAEFVQRKKLGLLKRVLRQKAMLPPACQFKFFATARPALMTKGWGDTPHTIRWGESPDLRECAVYAKHQLGPRSMLLTMELARVINLDALLGELNLSSVFSLQLSATTNLYMNVVQH